jgi:hypothetical protein
VNGSARAHDVANGIDRAYLVEVHLLDVHAVHCRFRLTESAKYLFCLRLNGGGKLSALNELQNSAEMAVLRRLVYPDAEFGGADAPALHSVPSDGRAESEGIERTGNRGTIGSGVCQGSDQHVAGKSGEGVDVTDRHGYFSLGDR